MTVHTPISAADPAPGAPGSVPPVWRLDDLYAGMDDPRIEQDLEAARRTVAELLRLKGALIGARAQPERLGVGLDRAISAYERAGDLLGAAGAYASLAASTARDDAAWAKFEGDLRTKSAAIGADTLFLTLELNQLEDWEVEAALKAHPRRALAALAAAGALVARARAGPRPRAPPDRPRPRRGQLDAPLRRDPGAVDR